jgi:hypothetical protein
VAYSEQTSPAGLDHADTLTGEHVSALVTTHCTVRCSKTQEIEDVGVLAARGAVRNSPLRRSSPGEIGLTRYAQP